MRPVIFLEFNELNLTYIEDYARRGALPNFAEALKKYGYTETVSEEQYEEIEPWIQWATVHTGLSFAEHRIFRLGDFIHADFMQIWEQLEAQGLKVGAVSPMNAANRLKTPAFFMPDPWTDTSSSGNWLFRKLGQAISQTVNDNAEAYISFKSALTLLLGAARYAYPSQYFQYLRDGFKSHGRPWRRALVLDRLIANVFEREWKRNRPDFSSLFLNGAAFVQHHYLFSSAAYTGPQKNPEWYVSSDEDPLLEVYRLYDDILGHMVRCKHARVMVATGLHQIPYGQVTYYWRLRNHEGTLRKWQVRCKAVRPRMSRDFLVIFQDSGDAAEGARVLESATAHDGERLFDVDKRNHDLFVTLTYPRDISKGFAVTVGGKRFDDFNNDVAFVAIKNAHHNGTGYFMDTGQAASQRPPTIPLAELKARVLSAFEG